jgi:mannosyl-oligosaccharide alpha-1,2-mannosidase
LVGKVTREPEKETRKPQPQRQPQPVLEEGDEERETKLPVPVPDLPAAAVPHVTPGVSARAAFTLQTGIAADPAKQDAVRAELKFAWDMYKKHAWGHDVLCPLSKRGRKWVGAGIQIIDALDTLYVAGLRSEFDEGIKWIETSLDFGKDLNDHLPLFEATIRVLGGLLGAHALSPSPVLAQKAKEIGDALFWAVSASSTSFPHPTSVWRARKGQGPQIVFAELATLQMEFVYLSALTGDMRYADGVMRTFRTLYDTGKGLFGENCDVGSASCSGKFSVGGGSDSGYEYFAKMFVLSGKKVDRFGEMWRRTVRELKPMYRKTSPSGLAYFGDSWGGGSVQATWGHLHCFIGGTYALMAQYAPSAAESEEELEVGAQIARTCHETYVRSPTGLGASGLSMTGQNDFSATSMDYVLRPEAIESWFYMYRHTKDEKYRDWAWQAFLSLRKNCRVDGGYAGLRNVNSAGSHEDTMETFLLAETFKYLYCIFSSETTCDLSKFVLNTEAHFIPILDPSEPRNRDLYKVMTT